MKPFRFAAPSLALLLLAATAPAIPVIQHSPVPSAEQGHPFGLRAAVRDATARIESVTLFYAASRSATPFRAPMSSSGAGLWYGSVPGHLVGPGTQLFYYIQAENADGETTDTPWYTVAVVPSADSPATIPSAAAVAAKAQSASVPPAAQAARRVQDQRAGSAAAQAAKDRSDNSKKYWIAAGVIAGGAVAVGGAIALSDSSSGGGSGSSSGSGTVTNGNFGGNYSISFTPSSSGVSPPADSPAPLASTDSGLVNLYVKDSSVEIVGLWGSEVLQGALSGNMFSAAANVSARPPFPAAFLSVSGQFSGTSCSATVNGTSTDASQPGTFGGSVNASRR